MARTGRPRKFKNAEELQKRIDDYFSYCDGIVAKDADGQPIFCKNGTLCYMEPPKPKTVTGLAYYLGLTREGLLEYQGRKDYSDTITRAKQRIEMYAEERLFDKDGTSGAQFSLRNNFKNWNVENEQRMQIELLRIENQMRTNETEAVFEDDSFIQALNGQIPDTWGDFERTERSAESDKE